MTLAVKFQGTWRRNWNLMSWEVKWPGPKQGTQAHITNRGSVKWSSAQVANPLHLCEALCQCFKCHICNLLRECLLWVFEWQVSDVVYPQGITLTHSQHDDGLMSYSKSSTVQHVMSSLTSLLVIQSVSTVDWCHLFWNTVNCRNINCLYET